MTNLKRQDLGRDLIKDEGNLRNMGVEWIQITRHDYDIKRIYDEASLWSMESGLHGGIPLDSPHRERQGYGGDALITAKAMMYALYPSGKRNDCK